MYTVIANSLPKKKNSADFVTWFSSQSGGKKTLVVLGYGVVHCHSHKKSAINFIMMQEHFQGIE